MKPEIKITRIFDADISTVWQSITANEYLKQWYFNLKEFKAEIGFKFCFIGGEEDGIKYNHLCEITEVVFEKKLTYSWKYEGYEGISFVTFEIFAEGEKTRLEFSHAGLSSFSSSNKDFAISNFEMGWNHIISNALPNFIITLKK